MLRHASLLVLSLTTIVSAQDSAEQPVPQKPVRTVLRALPLGGDDDPNSQPLPGEEGVVIPVKPAAPAVPVAPVVQATPIPSVEENSPLNVRPVGDDALRLQIFLDQSNFGPGIVDGKPGHFTDLAVQSWNEVNGYPLDDWSAANAAAREAVPNPHATAIVPDFVGKWINSSLPTSVAAQAKCKQMSYRSVVELMAERYHCSEEYLILINGKKKVYNLKARDTLMVPNIQPFAIEALTGAKYLKDEMLSQRHAVVDTKANQVRIFEAAPAALAVAEPGEEAPAALVRRPNKGLIASFPITPGQPKFIHYGKWEVRNSVELPTWRYDKSLLNTGKRSADSESLEIPPGPNCPVGVFWCGLSRPGIGMHGTPNPETIGRARSHGCIRMANWDAVRLPTLIRPGTTVEIR